MAFHFRPSSSLTRSPKHMATIHMVRNGSGMCSNSLRNSSADSAVGSFFRTVLYTYEAHGVELIGNQLPSHRRVEQHAHHAFQMGLALRCEIEFLQPVFNEQGFDLVEWKLTPFGIYVVLKP